MEELITSVEELKQSIITMAVEAWRFRKTFEKAISKIDREEGQRYLRQFNWFMRQVDISLNKSGMKYVSFEGQEFTEGMPVIPLNIDEFGPEDILLVEQMIEPVIMEGDNLKKTGTAILRRVEK